MTDIIPISPESLEVANSYIATGSMQLTAEKLRVPQELVQRILAKREVKSYVDSVFLDAGFRNRDKLASTLDTLIENKLSEMAESGVSSSKDIMDLLQFAHKIRMDELKLQKELMEAESKKIHNQTNIQINGGYESLLEKLVL